MGKMSSAFRRIKHKNAGRQQAFVKDSHERSIKSTILTIAGYLQEIRAFLDEDDKVHGCSGDGFSPDEQEAAVAALANMELIIERYRDEFNFSNGEIDLKWKVFVLAETMENLVHDMNADRLNKKYGALESSADREKIGQMQEELREQIRRLKEASSGNSRRLQ
jgi:hypothetical protein